MNKKALFAATIAIAIAAVAALLIPSGYVGAQGITQPVVQVTNTGKPIQKTYQVATGAAAIATTCAPSASTVGAWELVGFKVHLSAAGGAANLTATTDAAAGAAYDTKLYSQDMTSVTDLVQVFDPPIPMQSGDEVDFAWTNGSTRTYGLTIIYQRAR